MTPGAACTLRSFRCSSMLLGYLGARLCCSSMPAKPLCARNHCSSMPLKPLCARNHCSHHRSHCALEIAAQACLRSHRALDKACLRRSHLKHAFEASVRSKSQFEVTIRSRSSKSRFEVTVRNYWEMYHRTLFDWTLLHFAPCMDMHGFALVYISIYNQTPGSRAFVPLRSDIPEPGVLERHLGYIEAMWAKMDRYRLISDGILTNILIFDDLYAQQYQKSVFKQNKKVGLQPELGVGVCCK